MAIVRRYASDDGPAVFALVEGLPEYFTSDVPAKAVQDANAHGAWVIEDSGTVVGVAVARRSSPSGAEILWLAVASDLRRQGCGTRLLDRVLEDLAADGVRVVEAKTLDVSAGYEPYVATRAFWDTRGFVHIDTIDPLPGWEPGNPAAIYVAALRATR